MLLTQGTTSPPFPSRGVKVIVVAAVPPCNGEVARLLRLPPRPREEVEGSWEVVVVVVVAAAAVADDGDVGGECGCGGGATGLTLRSAAPPPSSTRPPP